MVLMTTLLRIGDNGVMTRNSPSVKSGSLGINSVWFRVLVRERI